jgi:hypothetical protein
MKEISMRLLTAAKLAIGSLICTYLLRLLGTVVPQAFRIEQMAAGAAGLHFVCGTALLVFFVLFLTEYIQQFREGLRDATYWAIAGAFVSPLLSLRALVLIVDPYILPGALRSPTIKAVLPVIGSVLVLVFFVRFREHLLPSERPALQRAVSHAALGFTVLFLLQTIVLLNYLATGTLRWLSGFSRLGSLGLLLLITLAVLAILSFFISFHRHLATVS